jgi:hypothetical protein
LAKKKLYARELEKTSIFVQIEQWTKQPRERSKSLFFNLLAPMSRCFGSSLALNLAVTDFSYIL